MIYRLMGRVARAIVAARSGERGQGTVEYVALILLVAALLAGVVAATKGTKFGTGGIAETIVKQIKSALDGRRSSGAMRRGSGIAPSPLPWPALPACAACPRPPASARSPSSTRASAG